MTLPKAFIEDIQPYLPAAELEEFIHALTEGGQPVSIRLNRSKLGDSLPDATAWPLLEGATEVGWCPEGRYLSERPQFTLDPLLHAGCYYVQEASSMFVTHVLRTFVHTPVTALDLCAAPGGKSTAALSALPQGSQLVSNEIDRKRARILAENIQKWGNPNVTVTANAPADFEPLSEMFDVIITDVPCSGEGMFRKDPGAIAEWNPQKVHECAALQRQILRDIWPSLKPGGLLIYSTCTFNVHEDEEQLQFLHDEFDAEILAIPTLPEWHIHPALCGSFAPDVRPESACRFMPHYTQGEGLFMAAIRKPGSSTPEVSLERGFEMYTMGEEEMVHAIPRGHLPLFEALNEAGLYQLSSGIDMGTTKGKDFIPAHAMALSTELNPERFTCVEVDLKTAQQYLRREAILLPEGTPCGYVVVCYQSHPLGFVKNIGNRSNNLYPTEWRIRNL